MFKKNEVAILRRAKRSMMRAMCDVKLVDKRNTDKLMDMLGLKEAADKLTRANGIRWYGHVLRQPEENVLMKAMVYEVNGKCKQGRLRMKWRKQVKGHEKDWFKERCGRSIHMEKRCKKS